MSQSSREVVILEGRLEGMGFEASCDVIAVRVSLPELDVFEYVQCDIHAAPEDLPDGAYLVTFDGRVMGVKKLDGNWLSAEF